MKHSAIEPLEARIAPAAFLTFTDVDGDKVDLVSNKALTGVVTFTGTGNPAEVLITGAGLDGASITTVVTKSATGDGFVNIGRIIATGLDLGAVTVKGDLGKIVCGNPGNPLPGLASLKVRSMGVYGTDTQGSGDLASAINGNVGSITVGGDVIGAHLNITGKLGTAKIGGDLRGSSAVGSGRISATGAKLISIGGDLAAGAGDESGKLIISGDLGGLAIGGSMFGALDAVADTATGQITVSGKAGAITIKRDVFGAASQEKAFDLRGSVRSLTIGGSIFGGSGIDGGAIYITGAAGAVKIGRDVVGGAGKDSGSIHLAGTALSLTIGRDLKGGIGENSAFISATGNIGPVKIGGDVEGNAGKRSAAVLITTKCAGFSVGGNVFGGSGEYFLAPFYRQIGITESTGPVRIGGNVIGGAFDGSGGLDVGKAPSFFLGGSLMGGGYVLAGLTAVPTGFISLGEVPLVTVLGDLRESQFGGGSMEIVKTAKLSIGGSIVGKQASSGFSTGGRLLEVTTLGEARIGGSILGGVSPTNGEFSVALGGAIKSIQVLGSLVGSGTTNGGSMVINGSIAKLGIGGSLDGGNGPGSGGISIGGTAGLVKIGGSMRSGLNDNTGGLNISGRVGTLLVVGSIGGGLGGNFTDSQVVAGSFGKVTIGGDLIGGANGAGQLRSPTGGFDAITIKGSMISGIAGAAIVAAKGLGVVKIGGSISGSTAMNHSNILALSATSITIGGDLITNGTGNNSLINIRESAGIVKIGGDVRGLAADPAHLVFGLTAGTATPGFTSLTIKGSVTHAQITGGVQPNYFGENGDAVLGPVTVGGDFIASSIAAGVNRTDMFYADANDVIIANATPALSRIAAITIKGQVLGTTTFGDHFGFIAQSIGPVKIGGATYTPGATPIELSPISDDVTVRLV